MRAERPEPELLQRELLIHLRVRRHAYIRARPRAPCALRAPSGHRRSATFAHLAELGARDDERVEEPPLRRGALAALARARSAGAGGARRLRRGRLRGLLPVVRAGFGVRRPAGGETVSRAAGACAVRSRIGRRRGRRLRGGRARGAGDGHGGFRGGGGGGGGGGGRGGGLLHRRRVRDRACRRVVSQAAAPKPVGGTVRGYGWI